jgi:ribulose-phosphate 3-epimerase
MSTQTETQASDAPSPPRGIQIGPSIITADLGYLADAIARAEEAGVDFIHLDIMDGSYVPNITFGPFMVETVRRLTDLPLDVHLMVVRPDQHIRPFSDAGADAITVHVEAALHLHAVLDDIRSLDVLPGMSLNPGTSLSSLEEMLPFVDRVLVMTVDPGFGGQSFIPTMLEKIRRLRAMIAERQPRCWLAVDGGIKPSNIGRVVDAGADMLVAGSAIYSPDMPVGEAVRRLRERIRA